MKILLFCSADLNTGGGSSIRARLISEGLHQCGAEVYVVSSGVPSSFADIGIKSNLLIDNKNWENNISEAVKSFMPDVIYGITEAGTNVLLNVSKKNNIPVVYDIHGIGVIEIIELGDVCLSYFMRIKNSLIWLSKLPKADAITVANPKLVYFIEMLNKNTVPVIGMTDISRFLPDGPTVQLGTDISKIQVLYAGNFFKWQGVDLLIDAIKILIKDDEPFEFTFLGSVGKNKKLIEKWMSFLPNDKVHFLDSVEYSEVSDYYRGADVLVIPRKFMLSTYLAFPQKIVDYMASGKTIVATDITPHRWALESPKAGIICTPTAQGLAEGIRKTKDSNLRKELSANARKIALDQFCHIKQSIRIYTLLNEMSEVE